MSFEDGLRVVKRRGEAMQAAADATPSGMVSILLLERTQVEQICAEAAGHGSIQIANYLCLHAESIAFLGPNQELLQFSDDPPAWGMEHGLVPQNSG